MLEGFWDTAKAAEYLGISKTAVQRLARRATLSYVRSGGRLFYRIEAVKALRRDPLYLARTRRTVSVQQLELAGQMRLGDNE